MHRKQRRRGRQLNGYPWEAVRGPLPNLKLDAKYKLPHITTAFEPQVVAEQFGPVPNYVLPHPAMNDMLTQVCGTIKRMGSNPPEPDLEDLKAFKRFVKAWCEKNLKPLSPDTDLSVESWLMSAPYPDARKEELKTVWDAFDGRLLPKHKKMKSFVKDEFYTDFKHARGIYSRSDTFKCFLAPLIKKVEEVVFARPEFIKKIPVAERPAYIMEMLGAVPGSTYCTDYTAFESHFIKILMEACEFVLMDHMVSCCPEARRVWRKAKKVLGGTNHCRFKFWTLIVEACRMSGEMTTSLFNGFFNCMLTKFLTGDACVGVFEGDDGLFRIKATTPPTPPPTVQRAAKLGMTLKIEEVESINEASFCGLVFDEEDLAPLVDVVRAMGTFGWSHARHVGSRPERAAALQRAKALSYLCGYYQCPIVWELARQTIRLTADKHELMLQLLNKTDFDSYRRDELMRAAKDWRRYMHGSVGLRSRIMIEERYGVTVGEQLRLERSFANMRDLLGTYEVAFEVPAQYLRAQQEYIHPHCFVPQRSRFSRFNNDGDKD